MSSQVAATKGNLISSKKYLDFAKTGAEYTNKGTYGTCRKSGVYSEGNR